MTRAAPPDVLRLDAADLDRLLASGGLKHHAPIVRAVRQTGALLLMLVAGGAVPLAAPSEGSGWCVIVGDDPPGGESAGPYGFDRGALRLYATGSTHVAIYSSAADACLYGVLGEMIAIGARLLLIETTPRHGAAWSQWVQRWAPRASVIEIQPAEDGA